MRRYVIYRCLYGSDFVQESIRSVLPFVDKVIVVWGGKPWGGVDHCMYQGRRIDFPERFDDLPEKVKEIDDPKVEFVEFYYRNPINQCAVLMNDVVIPRFGKPDTAIFQMVTMVWRHQELEKALQEFEMSHYFCANSRQVELWRGLNYRVPERPRAACGFWNLRNIARMPPTWCRRRRTIFATPRTQISCSGDNSWSWPTSPNSGTRRRTRITSRRSG